MNAKEARKLTDKNLHGQVIAPAMAGVQELIKQAAEKGLDSVMNPFHGMNLTPDQERAITQALRKEGFDVINHSDPDPGHPGSGCYTTIEW